MEKTIKADWTIVEQDSINKFSLYNNQEPSLCPSDEIKLKNVEINISKGILSITGTKVLYRYLYFPYFDSLESLQEMVEQSSIKFDYKNLWDRLRSKKTPCLQGYCKLKETVLFKWSTSSWTIKDYRNLSDMY